MGFPFPPLLHMATATNSSNTRAHNLHSRLNYRTGLARTEEVAAAPVEGARRTITAAAEALCSLRFRAQSEGYSSIGEAGALHGKDCSKDCTRGASTAVGTREAAEDSRGCISLRGCSVAQPALLEPIALHSLR